jgi:hypothetical protein
MMTMTMAPEEMMMMMMVIQEVTMMTVVAKGMMTTMMMAIQRSKVLERKPLTTEGVKCFFALKLQQLPTILPFSPFYVVSY